MKNFTDYGRQIAEVKRKAEAHAVMMEAKEYETREDWQRDFSIGIELYQQYADLLGEMVDDRELLPLTDYVGMT